MHLCYLCYVYVHKGRNKYYTHTQKILCIKHYNEPLGRFRLLVTIPLNNNLTWNATAVAIAL